jgi:membrane-associated phospholipid phosphatase
MGRSGNQKPFEFALLAYLVLVSLLIVLRMDRVARPWSLIGWHALLVGGIVALGRLRDPGHRLLRFARTYYFMLVVLFLYWELGQLGKVIRSTFLDQTVAAWEYALFGSQPAAWLADAVGSRLLTDLFMMGYLSYYVVIPLLLIPLFIVREGAFQRAAFGVTVAYCLCFFFYLFFPSSGPCWFIPGVDVNELQGYFFTELVKKAHSGAVRTAAFPSSHVAVSVVVLGYGARYLRPLFWIELPLVLLLAVGTVWGKFHFAIDALAGIALGIVLFLLSEWIYARFFQRFDTVPSGAIAPPSDEATRATVGPSISSMP